MKRIQYLCILVICSLVFPFYGVNAHSEQDENSSHTAIYDNKPAQNQPARTRSKQITARIDSLFNIMGMELRDRKYTSRNVQYLHDQMLYAGAKISFMGVGLGAPT